MAEEEKKDPNSDEQILVDLRKGLKECIDEEETERAKMEDDLRFAALDQWPVEIRKEREGDLENGPRPCLTIDKYSQFHMQVLNDISQGKPGINVRPQDDAADIKTAKVLKGLVRNIEDQSKADISYRTAADNQIKIGLGYFRITTEYVSDDSDDQDLFIRSIPNTFSVYLGKHIMPDGSDAEKAYIIEQMPLARFKEEYPGKKCDKDSFDGLQDQVAYWHSGEMITVVEEYCFYRYRDDLQILSDGTTIGAADYKKWPAEAGPKPEVVKTRGRMVKQLKWRKVTGVEVLDKRDLPGKYIPVVEVVGRETWVDGKRVLWGMVRPAKDSLRMYNYWASTLTEKFGLAPKTPFIGAVGQFATMKESWRKANKNNYSFLEYDPIDVNGNAIPPPQRQGPTPMEAAYFTQMQTIEHDVQTSLGMFKAATGESESQQSGRAIMALQKESDTGTYHFGANLGVSIRHAGRIIVDLIPHYYDTRRVIRIIGDDGEIQTATIDPAQQTSYQEVRGVGGIEEIYNPSVGQYDVSITVGPSYNTKRMEDQAMFVEMAKGASDPASAAAMRYLVVRNSDNPGAQEAAKIFKALLPPQALQAMDSKDPIPPRVQAMMQQMQAQMAQMQEAGQELQAENQKLMAGEQSTIAKIKAEGEAEKIRIEAQHRENMSKLTLERDIAKEKARLAQEVAEADARLKRDIAKAEHQVAIRDAQFDRELEAAKDPVFKTILDTVDGSEAMSETIEQITQGISEAIQVQTQVIFQMVQQISQPKTVKLEGIGRGDGGEITGVELSVAGPSSVDVPTVTAAPREKPSEIDEAPEVNISKRMTATNKGFQQLIDGINQSMQAQTQALQAISQEIAKPVRVKVG